MLASHVAVLQSRHVSGPPMSGILDENSGSVRHIEGMRQALIPAPNLRAQAAAGHLPGCDQVIHYVLGHVDGNGEADAGKSAFLPVPP